MIVTSNGYWCQKLAHTQAQFLLVGSISSSTIQGENLGEC